MLKWICSFSRPILAFSFPQASTFLTRTSHSSSLAILPLGFGWPLSDPDILIRHQVAALLVASFDLRLQLWSAFLCRWPEIVLEVYFPFETWYHWEFNLFTPVDHWVVAFFLLGLSSYLVQQVFVFPVQIIPSVSLVVPQAIIWSLSFGFHTLIKHLKAILPVSSFGLLPGPYTVFPIQFSPFTPGVFFRYQSVQILNSHPSTQAIHLTIAFVLLKLTSYQ